MSKWKFAFVAPPPRCSAGAGCVVGRVAVSRSDSRAGVCCSCVICRVAAGGSGSVLVGVDDGCGAGAGAGRWRCCDGGCCAKAETARRAAKISAKIFMAAGFYDSAMRRSILLFSLPLAAAPPGAAEAVHRVYTIDEDGMPGRREEWDSPTLQRSELITHEHDQTLTVYNGTEGWRKDWNGFGEKLAGDDLRREADIALIETYALDRAAGKPMPAGSEVTFTLDPATGMPLRATMPSFDGALTIAFADWRPVGALMIPFTETWNTGPNTTIAHLKSVELVNHTDLKPPMAGPNEAIFIYSN